MSCGPIWGPQKGGMPTPIGGPEYIYLFSLLSCNSMYYASVFNSKYSNHMCTSETRDLIVYHGVVVYMWEISL